MTLEELIARESIRDTLANASRAGDHLLADEYAGCFASGGVLEFGNVLYKEGRAQIREWVESAKQHETKRGLVRHTVTSTCITLNGPQGAPESAPESADVRSYYHVYTDIGPDHFGWYQDSFVPEDGRWLLKRRTVGVDWMNPESRAARNAARRG